MRVKLLCLSFLFFCVDTFAFAKNAQVAAQNNSDLYWLSYSGNKQGTFLMQIDSTGKIVRAPRLVSEVFGPTISLNGPNRINVWGDNRRAVIDEKTLSIVQTVKTTIGGPDIYAGSRGPDFVTKKPGHNFAVIAERYQSLKFFGVSRTGVQNRATWTISSSSPQKGLCGFLTDCIPGIVSSDGKTVFWSDWKPTTTDAALYSLYIQSLLDTGRPDSLLKLFGHEEGQVVDADISNVLPGGKIFAIYVVSETQLILQAVNAQTGQRIGDRVLLGKRQFGYFADAIAIDPLGRFVVFGHSNKQNVGFTSFLPLDKRGHPSGPAKVLVRKDFPRHINLLKD